MKKIFKKNFRKGERGNVLFLILIAVALFAALSYAVTSSSRSGGGDANEETNLVNSAALTQYPSSVRTSIIRMLVSNGVASDQLLFDRPVDFAANCTGTAAASCVFHPSGGGATSVLAPAEVMEDGAQGDWIFTSDYEIENIGVSDIGATANNTGNDVIAFLPGVSRAVCLRLNTQLGIASGTDADSDGIPDGATAIPVAADEMDAGNAGIGPAAPATKELLNDLSAQPFGCYDAIPGTANGANQNVYYHVLIER